MPKKRIYKPKNDDEFLSDLAFIIFVAGFRYSLVSERFPLIKKAFHNFSINKLSKFEEKDIEKIMKAKGMIKNRQKINAIVENAKKCIIIQQEFGSVLKWIKKKKTQHNKNPLFNPSLEEVFQKFSRIGKVTSGWLASLHNSKKNYIEYEVPG